MRRSMFISINNIFVGYVIILLTPAAATSPSYCDVLAVPIQLHSSCGRRSTASVVTVATEVATSAVAAKRARRTAITLELNHTSLASLCVVHTHIQLNAHGRTLVQQQFISLMKRRGWPIKLQQRDSRVKWAAEVRNDSVPHWVVRPKSPL